MSQAVEDVEAREIGGAPSTEHASYEVAVGNRATTYYSETFQLFDETPSLINTSWNWSAFLFHVYWAMYRKLYGPSFLALAILILTPLIFGREIFPIAILVVMISFGVFGNALYHHKIKRLLSLARIRHRTQESQGIFVRLKGGVNMWVPVALVTLLSVSVLAAVSLAGYENYQKRAAGRLALSPTAGPPKPAATVLGRAYYQRISEFNEAINKGLLATVSGTVSSSPRASENPWPNEAIIDLESTQTWWIAEGVTYIHLVNSSAFNLASLSFSHRSVACENKGPDSFYTVQLSHFLKPGQEAVAIINAGMASKSGCLIVYRAWG